MTTRHIVPFGGLRPLPGPGVHPLISYVLDITGKPRPRVAGLMTATGDDPAYINAFYSRFPVERCYRSHVALFSRTISDLRAFLLEQDVIFVGGGNTMSMLAVWRAHGVDTILREAWEAGIVLCGGSAGSLCWFECGTTDSFSLYKLEPLRDGLGFIPGSHCPHYDGEAQRRPLYHSLIADGFPAGIAIDDDAAAHFIGTDLSEVISAREGATAYLVERAPEGGAKETPYEPRLVR